MKCHQVAVFVLTAQCCLFAAASHAHANGDSDSVLEAALRPLYSQLDVFREQLDAVKVFVHVPCKKDVRECSRVGPLGMEDSRIPDASITASSFFSNQAGYGPTMARLNNAEGFTAWAKDDSDDNPWIQVGFGSNVIITGLITQGRGNLDQWVTEFQVAHSIDGQQWTDVIVGEGSAPTKFPGNSDRDTHVTTTFHAALQARFLRILPTEYHTHCSMRFEVLGCNE